MKARCPRCGCEFEAGGHSEGATAVQIAIGAVVGVGIGVLLAVGYFLAVV